MDNSESCDINKFENSFKVAGLRAALKKNLIEYLEKENADIICLNEIKCAEADIPKEAKMKGNYELYLISRRDFTSTFNRISCFLEHRKGSSWSRSFK